MLKGVKITLIYVRFRSKPMKSATLSDPNVIMLPDEYITMINEFVREEDSKYVFITKRLTIAGIETINNDTTEIKYSKAGLSEAFFILKYERGGRKRTSQKRRRKKSRIFIILYETLPKNLKHNFKFSFIYFILLYFI